MKTAIGTYTGNGADDRALTGWGLSPDLVLIFSGNPLVARTSLMAGDVTRDIPNQLVFFANGIQSIDADGITVGTDIRVNANGTVYYYAAFEEAGGNDFKVLTYTGSGADSRSITGVGFQPDFVLVWKEGTGPAPNGIPQWTNVENTVGNSRGIPGTSVTDRIQALESDGFQVGTDEAVNASGITYHAACFKKATGFFNVIEYTGDGIDDRSITGAGFQPDLVIVQRDGASAMARTSSHVGDTTTGLESGGGTNRIQAMQADGFQVGTRTEVNLNGSVYQALVWKIGTSTAPDPPPGNHGGNSGGGGGNGNGGGPGGNPHNPPKDKNPKREEFRRAMYPVLVGAYYVAGVSMTANLLPTLLASGSGGSGGSGIMPMRQLQSYGPVKRLG